MEKTGRPPSGAKPASATTTKAVAPRTKFAAAAKVASATVTRPSSSTGARPSSATRAGRPTSAASVASHASVPAESIPASNALVAAGTSKVARTKVPSKPQNPRVFPAWLGEPHGPGFGIEIQEGKGLNNGNPTFHSRIYTFSGPLATKEDVYFEHREDGSKYGKAHKLYHQYQEKRIGDGKDVKFEIEGRDFNPAHYAEVPAAQIGKPSAKQLKKFESMASKIEQHRKDRLDKYRLVEQRWAQMLKESTVLTYKNIPWPDFKKKNGLLPFLLDPARAPFQTKAQHEEYLRVLKDRWDVASFDRALGHRIADDDRERIIARVDEISQIVGPKDVV